MLSSVQTCWLGFGLAGLSSLFVLALLGTLIISPVRNDIISIIFGENPQKLGFW